MPTETVFQTDTTAAALAVVLGTPDAPLIVDICLAEDFALDPRLIPGARRIDHAHAADALAGANRPVVVVCQKGRKLSQGVAARLRAMGRQATALEGGAVGWAAGGWPMLRAEALPEGREWVTAARCTAATLLSAWVLRRWIDSGARLLFVPGGDTADVAARFDACHLPAPSDLAALFDPAPPVLAPMTAALDAPGLASLWRGLEAGDAPPETRLATALPVLDALARGLASETRP